MKRMLTARWFLSCLVFLGQLFSPCSGQGQNAPVGGTYAEWSTWSGQLKKDPSLIRLYTFDNLAPAAARIPDEVSSGNEMTFELVGKKGLPPEKLEFVPGRWKGSIAVRLDQGFLGARPFPVENRSFTVEAWLRVHGYGIHRGNNRSTNGTLLSIGIGYWDGWRLTLSYPSRVIGFEIGRPKPSHSVGIRTSQSISDEVWFHLAASWDGREMRIYLNGFPAARGAYTGPYTRPRPDGQFRIGYADSGWGSVKMEADEVAVYRRALGPDEVFQHALFYTTFSGTARQALLAADRAADGEDYSSAVNDLKGLLREKGLHPDLRAAVLLRIVDLETREGGAPSVARLAQALDAPGLSAQFFQALLRRLYRLALNGGGASIPPRIYQLFLKTIANDPEEQFRVRFRIASIFRSSKQYARARENLTAIATAGDASPVNRAKALLELGHISFEERDFTLARSSYQTLAATEDAPGYFQAYARWLSANCLLREKKISEARAALQKLGGLSAASRYFREKALRRLSEPPFKPGGDRKHSRARRTAPKPKLKFYVSPRGTDRADGSFPHPFGSLEGARDVIRRAKSRGPLPRGGVAVIVRGGEFPVERTFALSAEDSGTAEAPIVYQAARGETPRFTGGVRLRGFRLLRDASALARLPSSAAGKVYVLDMKEAGAEDLGQLQIQGYGFGARPSPGLYFNGEAMRLAGWPNEGFARTGKVLDKGDRKVGRGPTFEFKSPRMAKWAKAPSPWAFGYWFHDWADGSLPVSRIDTEKGTLTLARPVHRYGIRDRRRFRVFDLLEELDAPGEYFLDRSNGKLYLYPPDKPKRARIWFSVLEKPLVELKEVSHVIFEGLTFETSRGNGVVIEGGSDCLLARCTIREMGMNAVVVQGGKRHGLTGCDFYTLGRGGVRLIGGERKTLSPGGHFIENCHIYDFSRIARTYTPAVFLDGVGLRVAHNLIHDAPDHAMRVEGNDHRIEFNEIHSVVYESDDQGGLDMWFNPTYRGNIIRYNYWHHIGSGEELMGQAGVRLDDAISEVLIYGNIFQRCSNAHFGGLQIHGGKENIVDNNLFIDCKYAVSFSPWGEKRWEAFLDSARVQEALHKKIEIAEPPYRNRYPSLARLHIAPDINKVWRNLVFDCGAFLTRDRDHQQTMDNTIGKYGPDWINPRTGRLELKKFSALEPVGFDPIPYEEIGLYRSPDRASWPVKHRVRGWLERP